MQYEAGVAALEDKIVQKAIVDVILTPIYEPEFLGFSYGFRPGRGAHNALDALAFGIERRKVNWIIDADIRAFFDRLSRDHLLRFLEHRIGDPRVLRLITKWLNAGVMEDDEWKDDLQGTPQGAVVSPILANVYLHYVLDLWFQQKWRARKATGDTIIVRYADDFVVGCQRKADAEQFLRDLKERLGDFALDLHPDKTRLIEFGRFALVDRRARGERRPETFDFLGFTHYCKKQRNGQFGLGRKPIARSADQLPDPWRLRTTSRVDLAQDLAPAVTEDTDDDGRCDSPQGVVLAPREGSAPLAHHTVCRQPPKVGAVCVNAHVRICAGGPGQPGSLPQPCAKAPPRPLPLPPAC